MVYDFRGPNPGPEWNSFSGPESGQDSNNFSGPGALGCGCSSGALWRPPFQFAHLCPPAILSGPEWNDFLGPEPSAQILCASWTFLFFGDLKLDLPVVEPFDH